MSDAGEHLDPLQRVEVPVTQNCVLRASGFCLEQCGLYGEAQLQAVMLAAMSGDSDSLVAGASWEGDEAPTINAGDTVLPNTIISCKGPRKKYLLFGELTCRGSARIDTV